MKNESEITFGSHDTARAAQQLGVVLGDITRLTEKLTGMVKNNDLDLLSSVFDDRRNLLNRAQVIRNQIAASTAKNETGREIRKVFSPLILRLYEADAQLVSTLSSRKNELRDQLNHIRLQQKVALYSR